MKIYIVQEKMFFNVNGTEYQMADALTPLMVVSNEKKAYTAMQDYIDYYKEQGFKETSTYFNLFPMVHKELKNDKRKLRVVIYYEKTEVK